MQILLDTKDTIMIVAALAYTIRRKRDALSSIPSDSRAGAEKELQAYKDLYNVMKFNKQAILTSKRWASHG